MRHDWLSELLAYLPQAGHLRNQICCKPGESSNGTACVIAATRVPLLLHLSAAMASHAQTVSNINSVLINFQVQLSAEPLVLGKL